MRNKLNLILPLIAVLVLVGCEVKDAEIKYPPEISYFESEFVDHFPPRVPNAYSGLVVSQNLSNSHPYVWLNFIATQEIFDSLKIQLDKKAVAIYSASDSCLLAIDRHLNSENWRDYDKGLRVPKKVDLPHKECYEGKLPVPNFYRDSWRDTDSNDTGLLGYKLYVLEAKSGIFMDSIKLPNGVYTPEGWKHGYSKGVALNEEKNEVIYWSDIW